MRTFPAVRLILSLVVVGGNPLWAQGDKLGKLHIKAAPSVVNGQEFPDFRREQTVKDMKKKPRRFYLTLNEPDADFLLVVLERREVGDRREGKTVIAALSARDGTGWKPLATLESGQQPDWPYAAARVTGQAEDWVIKNLNPAQALPKSTGQWPAGFYVRKGKPNDYIELGESGTFLRREWLDNNEGQYAVSGDTLSLTSPGWKKAFKITPDAIVENNGALWERSPQGPSKAADPPQAPGSSSSEMSVEKIIEMVRAKISDDIIILSIQQARARFALTPDLLLRLKAAGVSDTVIKAMAKSQP